MNTEEAIKVLGNFKRFISGGGATSRTDTEAIDIAIEALKEKPRIKSKWVKWWGILEDPEFTVYHTPHAKCGNCNTELDPGMVYETPYMKFCPICGAEMEN